MLKLKNLAVLVVLALLVSVSGVLAQDGTIVDVAAGNEDFSTLVSLVQAAGLVDVLNGEGPYTVFAPTNEAFAKLSPVTVAYLTSHPELLTRVLTYHVVSGAVMSADITESMMADSMEMGSVGGDMMGSQLTVTVTDAGIKVDQANVVTPDIAASNGVIHAIDSVLIPAITLEDVLPSDVTGDIITAGSSTVAPLTTAMIEAFKDEGYAGEVTVEVIGTGAGAERFCKAGDTDVFNASRAIKQEEIDNCAALATPRVPVPLRVGTDGIAVVVSADNDFVTDVTKDELAAIFSTATNWSDVRADWPAEPIQRFVPGTDSGTYDFFNEVLFAKDATPLQSSSNLQQSEDDNVLVQGVEGSPYAVGFFGYAYFKANAAGLKDLAIDGLNPTEENVDSGKYLLSRPLYVYTDAGIVAEKPQVGQFLSYYLNNVNDFITEVGYFPANAFALNAAKLNLLAMINQ